MAHVSHFFVIFFLTTVIHLVEPRKILLEDLRTLTLRHGEWTTSRRSSAVPQLKCVGGTAGCHAFIPQHVQCYNRGSDGYDIQWECKTEMDKRYRFGKIDVTCEGYEYADDPHVLAGSCGLEYAMDAVSGSASGSSYSNSKYDQQTTTTGFGTAVGFLCVIMILFFVYRTCVSTDRNSNYENIPPPPSYSESCNSSQYPNASAPPPPYGFRPEYHQQQQQPKQYPTNGSQNNNGQPGFFSGMMAGGLLGYLFGNNRSGSGYDNYGYRHQQRDLFGNQRGGGSFNNWTNSGSQTSSGFGGTKRR